MSKDNGLRKRTNGFSKRYGNMAAQTGTRSQLSLDQEMQTSARVTGLRCLILTSTMKTGVQKRFAKLNLFILVLSQHLSTLTLIYYRTRSCCTRYLSLVQSGQRSQAFTSLKEPHLPWRTDILLYDRDAITLEAEGSRLQLRLLPHYPTKLWPRQK